MRRKAPSGDGGHPPAVLALGVLAELLGRSSIKESRMADPPTSIQAGGDWRMDTTSTRPG